MADAKWMLVEDDSVAPSRKLAEAVGTVCFLTPDDQIAWLAEQQPRKVSIPEELNGLFAQLAPNVEVTGHYSRDQVDGIDAAITPAAGAVAESGSIMLTDRTTTDRLAELRAWTHIAIVRKESIHRTIADALASMPDDPNIIRVTGPSKAADVEVILIESVHGPGAQGCLLICCGFSGLHRPRKIMRIRRHVSALVGKVFRRH